MERLEAADDTFYDDQTYGSPLNNSHGHNHGHNGSKESMKNLKHSMTLDFNSTSSRPAKRQKFAVLSSPDMRMLQLESPELEKIIIQNGIVTTTPTPTQFLFPKNVTQAQDDYAKGFVEALASLQSGTNPDPVTTTTTSRLSDTLLITRSSGGNQAPIVTVTTSSGGGGGGVQLSSDQTSYGGDNTAYPPTSLSAFIPVQIKEEPQTVPNLGATPPLSPIDMENQERIKLERKRQRNRIAASKCRRRKLERIARLEDQVKAYKGENGELSTVVSKLRDQVCRLKQQVMEHVSSGCQMMASQCQF